MLDLVMVHAETDRIFEFAQDRDRSAETILLAGTDLIAAFPEKPVEFPSVDCAAIHLADIMQGLLS